MQVVNDYSKTNKPKEKKSVKGEAGSFRGSM